MSNLGFEGFDHESNYHLSEKEERNENWAQAKIWVVLGIFIALLLCITIFLNGKELVLKYTGNAVVTDYVDGASSVSILDNHGEKHNIYISDIIITPKDGKLTLYYKGDNIKDAKALNAMWFWVIMYSIWIPLFTLCIHLILKNLNQGKKIYKKDV